MKYIYTAMVIAGVLLPCVPAVINLGFGYGIMSFSPMVCFLAVQDVGFYADALVEGINVDILVTLQALVILKLTKVCITTVSRCITCFRFYVGLLCICEKINFFVFLFCIVCAFIYTFSHISIACCTKAHIEDQKSGNHILGTQKDSCVSTINTGIEQPILSCNCFCVGNRLLSM